MTKIKESIIKFIVGYYKKTQFYPSYDEIAKGVHRTKSVVHVHMNKLENEGIIIRKYNYSSQYRLINMDFICKQKINLMSIDKVIEKLKQYPICKEDKDNKKMTNADKIRNLSNVELAMLIDDSKKFFNCDVCSCGNKRKNLCKKESCMPYIKEWLERRE